MGSRQHGWITAMSGKRTRPFFIGLRLFLVMSICLWSMGPAIAVAADEIAPPPDTPASQPAVETAPADAPPPADAAVDTAPAETGDGIDGTGAPADAAQATTVEGVPVEAAASYNVSGYVKDANGTPMNNVKVNLKKGWLFNKSDDTDATGYFKISGSSSSAGSGMTLTVENPTGYYPSVPASYTCNAGTTYANKDFTLTAIPKHDISGRAWIDLNGNGSYDAPLEALSGWTVHIDHTGSSGSHYTVTTLADGTYTANVYEGTYKVAENLIDATYAHVDPLSGEYSGVNINQNLTGYDFQNKIRDYTIHGHVYDDTNGNGHRDGGEPGLSGATVNLTGSLSGSQQTDGDGGYTFNVPAGGDYSVTVEQQNGMSIATEPVAAMTYSHNHIIKDQCGDDFGCYEPMTISGTKFNDLNGNGVWDEGEPPIAGVTIYLDLNNNGELDSCEPSTVTAADGTYTLTDISSKDFSSASGSFWDWLIDLFFSWSSYNVREVVPADWSQTKPGDSHKISWDWPWHDDKSVSYKICKESGGVYTDKDFGNRYDETTTVSGTKWFDLNGNGILDVSETTALEGWTIFIDYNRNGVLDEGEPSDVTDANGDYTIEADNLPFDNVDGTSFAITEVVPTLPVGRWIPTNPASGAQELTLQPGDEVDDIDFLNTKCATIAGNLWDDLNRNGVQDPGEPALPGWTIYLDPIPDNDPNTHIREGVTGASGEYYFTCFPPGQYLLTVVAPPGWESTYPQGGFSVVVTVLGGQTLDPVTALGFGGAVAQLLYTGK
jgi:serine-aspartate repeat-containing protein C/D/E